MADWNPAQYLAFANERGRPAIDLLSHVPQRVYNSIVDLGCGPGNSTELLRRAFPRARITGIDSSQAMIDRARLNGTAAVFEKADVTAWQPAEDVDLIFSNAMFQWVNERDAVLRRLFAALKPGAVLAIQMPDNLDEPSHRQMREVAARPHWQSQLANAAAARSPLASAQDFYKLFQPLAAKLDVWRTTYHHRLDGHQGIIDMLSSTGLRPFIDPLDPAQQKDFLAEYRQSLSAHYPAMADGAVLLAFPRLFIVASRGDSPAAI